MRARSGASAAGARACGPGVWWATRPLRAAPSRQHLRSRRVGAVIPAKTGERRRPRFDRAAYRARNRVERLFNRLKQFRRIATRYEKRAPNYLAMLHLGAILIWLQAFADTT